MLSVTAGGLESSNDGELKIEDWSERVWESDWASGAWGMERTEMVSGGDFDAL